jgi:alkaline phosphatase D
MTRRPTPLALAVLLALAAPGAALAQVRSASLPVERVVFGSDFAIMGPRGVWDAVAAEDPHLLLLAGGSVDAGNVLDQAILRSFYTKLAGVTALTRLRSSIPTLAVWNDGEYGCVGCGSENHIKRNAQAAFFEFFGPPPTSTPGTTPGVYQSRLFGAPGRLVQVVMLDTLFFRDPLQRSPGGPDPAAGVVGPLEPTDDFNAWLLGPQQWTWLEAELSREVDLRIIVSPIQILAEGHGEECWALFPPERERLVALLNDAPGAVALVSGGRGFAEVSAAGPGDVPGLERPLVEVTAGSWNRDAPWTNSRNPHREGSAFFGANYGAIEIGWDEPDPTVTLAVRDGAGGTVIRVDRTLSGLAAAGAGGG